MSNFASPVKLYMSSPVLTVHERDSLAAVDEKLRQHRISSLAVVNREGQPVGVISRTDLIRIGQVQTGRRPNAASLVLPDHLAASAMHKGITSITPDESLRVAAKKLIDNRIHRLFVVHEKQLVGVLSTKDIMFAICDEKVRKPISSFMNAPVISVRANEPIAMATERLEKARVSGVVVIDEGWPVGMFTQVESLLSAELPRDTPVEEVMSHSMVCMDTNTYVHRAAAQAAETRIRRVIAVEERRMKGILTGIDFARATQ